MKKIYFAQNSKYKDNNQIELIRATDYRAINIRRDYFESEARFNERIMTLKETLSLNFVTGSEEYNNFNAPSDENEIDTISKIKYKSYKALKDSYIGKVFNENKIVFIYMRVKESPSTILSFQDRDVDIMEAILNEQISLSIANALIIGRNLNDNKTSLYRHFQIAKSNGKMRDIYEPQEDLKNAFKDINRVLQATFDSKKQTNQFAYIKNRNIVKNAEIHMNNKYTIKTDITAFFESTKVEYYSRYLKFLCKNTELRDEFYKLIVNPKTDGLYMGNPISGTLTNLVMHKAMVFLQNIFDKNDISVSVYADDIVVSSSLYLTKEYVTDIINYVFEYYKLDYTLKPEKTVRLTNQNRRICGVTINHKNQLTVKRSDYENIRVTLYKMNKGEPINVPINTFKGRLNFYLYVDKSGKFNKLLDKYNDVLKKIGFKYAPEQIMMDIDI